MEKEFEYLNIKYKITDNQFKNILAFLSIFSDLEKLYNTSPEYILEKFNMYIGGLKYINNNIEFTNGIHPVLEKRFIEEYYKRWGNIDKWDFYIESNLTTNELLNDV